MFNTSRIGWYAFLGLTVMAALFVGAQHALAQDDPDQLELVGTLDSFDADTGTMVVSGLEFDVSTAEVAEGLIPGDRVKVHATLSEDGGWEAREVEGYTPDDEEDGDGDSGNKFEITGTLDEVGEETLVVSGLTINTLNAEIKGELVQGDRVKVEGSVVDGEWVAREVKAATPDDDAGDDIDDDDSDDDLDDDGDDGEDDDADDATGCTFEIEVSSANLRSGPGTGYDVVGFAFDDEEFPAIGVHEGGEWLQVLSADLGEVWVAASVGELDGDCSGLDVSDLRFKDDDDDDGDGDHDGDDGDDHDDGDDSDDAHDGGDEHDDDHHDDDHHDDD